MAAFIFELVHLPAKQPGDGVSRRGGCESRPHPAVQNVSAACISRRSSVVPNKLIIGAGFFTWDRRPNRMLQHEPPSEGEPQLARGP